MVTTNYKSKGARGKDNHLCSWSKLPRGTFGALLKSFFCCARGSPYSLSIFRKAAKMKIHAHMSRYFPLKCPSNYGNTTTIKGKLIRPKSPMFPQASHNPRNLQHIPAITITGYTKPPSCRKGGFAVFYRQRKRVNAH